MRTPHWLRFVIAGDQMLQVLRRRGIPGVTISAWIGTGCAHKHKWALAAKSVLETWPVLRRFFGPGHCAESVQGDIDRAKAAIEELTQPEVTAWVGDQLRLKAAAEKQAS